MADKRFRGRDKIVQKMTKDGLVEENLRTGETKSAVAEEPPKQEDSEKDAVESAEETPVVEEEVCMDAEEGEEEKPRRSTAKQSTEYYKAHQEDGKAKEKDASPVDEDAEPALKKKGRLSFDDEQQGGIVRGAGLGIKKVAKKGVDTATGFAHNKVHQVEKENSGVESAHKSEETLEELYRFSKGRKKTREKSARAEKRGGEDQKSSRLKFSESEGGMAEEVAETSLKKKQHLPPPTAAGGEATKTVGSKFYQKKQYKDAYAAAKRGRKAGNAASKQAATAANTLAEKAKAAVQEIVVQNKTLWAGLGIAALMLMLIMGGLQSCTAMFGSAGTGVAATSYLSEDSDMLGAEAAYADMEADLQYELDNYESLHPGYDEYRFDLDEIGHDPYVLTSILSALHEGVYTLGDVQGDLAMLFEKQYTLTQTIETETRYRTETRTDSEGNPYTVQVPYTYYICNVKLENFDMSHLPVYIMGEDQMSLYAVYMSTLGNRPDLFPTGTYPNASTVKEPTYYDIPPEALEDATFAAMMAEAEKYIGYPYVWGGSSPSTSFDCSGFVSWVINHSGWDVGRLGAQGLCNICTPVSPEQAKPGDLVFFVGTYDTPGVSHVGIYVGNSVMLHCGDPISYTNLNSSYWQEHFYCYGRLP